MINHPYIKALEDMTREFKNYLGDISLKDCDHDAGICYCEIFRAIEVAEKILHVNKLLDKSSSSVECPYCHWGFAPSVIQQHIKEKHWLKKDG